MLIKITFIYNYSPDLSFYLKADGSRMSEEEILKDIKENYVHNPDEFVSCEVERIDNACI